MGPFELMDLAGLDVNLAAARGIWDGLGRPEHLRPSPIQEQLVAAGRLGRKTGEGFYRYAADGTREPADAFATAPGSPPDHVADATAIVARITAAIDAEAERAVADGVASRDDIELALRLGAGHPLRSTP
jgi:3-hydroxybutyryl-CoA dehydrogenase